jgi:predicted  nucleic acid-binding Zn-ribbon protein
MDWQTGFNVMFGIAGSAVLLYVAIVQRNMDNMKRDFTRENDKLARDNDKLAHDLKNVGHVLSNLRETIPATYATIEDLNRGIDQVGQRVSDIFTVLSRIDEKIEKLRDSK